MKKLKIVVNSPIVLCFVFISFLAVLLGSGNGLSNLVFSTYRSSWSDPMTYVRLLAHVLGHNGWDHFVGNMGYLLLLGPGLEEKYGSGRILGIILLTAVITGAVNNIFFPGVSLCGASGIVFAFILLTSFTGFRDGEIPLTFILVAVIFLGQQVYEGIFLQDNIANLSHIIGGLIGSAAGYVLNKNNNKGKR